MRPRRFVEPVRPVPQTRINENIRVPRVRLIDEDGTQLGIKSTKEALAHAEAKGLDLVEVAAQADPPVAKVMDYGKYRYEQAKKEKETKKHQHAGAVKEVQLSPRIDPHDLGVKTTHAIDFLCEDMKVKVTLKFRGREMQHTEFGFQVIKKFLENIAPYGHPDFDPKLIGKGINVMISPLPRNKRAKNPNQAEGDGESHKGEGPQAAAPRPAQSQQPNTVQIERKPKRQESEHAGHKQDNFANNPFAQIEIK